LHNVDLSGAAIVKETLRRLCVWKPISYNANMYWDYVIYHKQECSDHPGKFGYTKCIEEAMRVAKIDAATVSHCMSDAGNLDQDVTNALLKDAVMDQSRSGVVVTLPALTVNRQLLRYTSARALFDTVCTEYWLSGIDTIPAVCETSKRHWLFESRSLRRIQQRATPSQNGIFGLAYQQEGTRLEGRLVAHGRRGGGGGGCRVVLLRPAGARRLSSWWWAW
jgi:hypothetical protein